MRRAVQRKGPELQKPGDGIFRFVLFAAAQVGLDAGHQLARAERLGDVVVSADLEAEYPVYLVGPGGKEQDGRARDHRIFAELAAQLKPIAIGEHYIEDDEDPASRLPIVPRRPCNPR